jgi:hypothetical protein
MIGLDSTDGLGYSIRKKETIKNRAQNSPNKQANPPKPKPEKDVD